MAIQFMDNYKGYGTNKSYMLDGLPYAGLDGVSFGTDPDPGASGNVIFIGYTGGSNNNNDFRIALPTPRISIGIAQRWFLDQLPADISKRPVIADFRDVNNNVRFCSVIVETNGSLSIYDSGMTQRATTGSPVISPRSWFHYECFYHAGTGAYEVRIEGVTVLTGSHSSLIQGTIYQVGCAGRINAVVPINAAVKDLVIWDTSGSQNNSFTGTVTVYRLPVNSDVSSGWTRSSGSSDYALLNESPPDDSGYISADASLPAPSIMGMDNLPGTVVGVRAVQTMVRAKKSDGGDCTMVVGLVSNGTTGNGASHNVTTASKVWFDVQELDPDTAGLWSPIAVNSVQLKINRTV